MLLHFGGSRNGLEAHPDDYLAIRDAILSAGHTLSRDWLKHEHSKGVVNLFTENEKAIANSDGIILDATYDTHGVGIQLALALMYKRPTLLLVRHGAKNPIPDLTIINANDKKLICSREYKNITDIGKILSDFNDWIQSHSRLARFNIELDRKLDNYLKLKAKLNQTSKSEEIRRLVEEDLSKESKG